MNDVLLTFWRLSPSSKWKVRCYYPQTKSTLVKDYKDQNRLNHKFISLEFSVELKRIGRYSCCYCFDLLLLLLLLLLLYNSLSRISLLKLHPVASAISTTLAIILINAEGMGSVVMLCYLVQLNEVLQERFEVQTFCFWIKRKNSNFLLHNFLFRASPSALTHR
jgi:hypothetical protein